MNQIRAQIYHYDQGVLSKAYIRHLTQTQFDAICQSEYSHAVALSESDPYGEKLPRTIKKDHPYIGDQAKSQPHCSTEKAETQGGF